MLIAENILEPSPSDGIKARIIILLQHYFIANLPESVNREIAKDWIEILKPYPFWAVHEACVNYLAEDHKGKKPTPGQIKNLCELATSRYNALIFQCKRVIKFKAEEAEEQEPISPEQKERAALMCELLKKSLRGDSEAGQQLQEMMGGE